MRVIAVTMLLAVCATSAIAQIPGEETILVPAVPYDLSSPAQQVGAAELLLLNASDAPVYIGASYACQLSACPTPSWPAGYDGQFYLYAPLPQPGKVVLISTDDSSKLTFSLRVYDPTTAQPSSGTYIPVVRERDFLTNKAELLRIPTDARVLDTLRIYGPDGQTATVHVRYFATRTSGDEKLLREEDLTLALPQFSDGYDPSFAEVSGLQNNAVLNGSPHLRIEITPVTPGLRFWAFVSVTNIATQRVTLITP